ncbi:hypothetical protein AAFF_G00012520 [Aldrovandia affinis]|uniref:Uncharacterized protein n=1 Tax=Aldrovandia affinis TaxID=143900 RepID=A0AAD7WI60_9TELE|nr:hypothetical protein AAFF_G00012520 [Aldrovandia affinis]
MCPLTDVTPCVRVNVYAVTLVGGRLVFQRHRSAPSARLTQANIYHPLTLKPAPAAGLMRHRLVTVAAEHRPGDRLLLFHAPVPGSGPHATSEVCPAKLNTAQHAAARESCLYTNQSHS